MSGRDKRRGISMTENGPPPDTAAALYVGDIMHQRTKPFGHRFRYRVFSLLVDLDRLEEAGSLSTLFSVNRGNLVSFHEQDHAAAGSATLRAYADRLLAEAGLERAVNILLVCYPRILGYVFNPLSVYHAYDGDGLLVAMIYEVRNTFGERHSYVCPVADGEMSESGLRQSCDKLFHADLEARDNCYFFSYWRKNMFAHDPRTCGHRSYRFRRMLKLRSLLDKRH